MYDDTISWNQQLKIYPLEACSISSLEFDPFEELLWIGSSSGRIQSYLTGIDFFENQEVDIDPMRYSSFIASESPIINIWPLDRTILQVSQTKCSMHTKGGMLMSNIATIDSYKELGTISEADYDYPVSFTCSSIYRKMKSTMTSYELEAQFSWQLPTHLFVGTNTKRAFCYDLNNISSRSKPSAPMQYYDTIVGSTCVKENGSFVFFGGNDGKVRLFDGRLNGERVQHVIDAHNGSLVDMSVHINGMIVATCGLQTRSINPYDPNSPVKYGSDPYFKLLDLRMMKSSASLALSAKAIPQSLRSIYFYFHIIFRF
jgi:WD40 repeat protein